MSRPPIPKAVKTNGARFSSKEARFWVRRAFWALGIVLIVMVVVLLGLGAAVRADVGCGACHTMDPYVAAVPESGHPALSCAECHASSGVLGLATDGSRAMSWMSGGEVTPVAYDDAPCVDCHANILEETVEARGIRVRHSDFADQRCTRCHAGTGHTVEGTFYRVGEMDDCMQCHRSSITQLDTCETCHVPDADAERRAGNTTWRVTHGAGWQQTHGMGDLRTCTACHEPSDCIDCHGVRVPHSADWLVVHGDSLEAVENDGCATCHETQWCVDCHGVEMPHPTGFLPAHGPEADEVGEDACFLCHNPENCNYCHLASSHPDLPGVTMGHDNER